jgi:hypothetical protein
MEPGLITGRRWSQLTSAYNDPYDILQDYLTPKDGILDDVMRLRLGLPYVSIEDKLRVQDVYFCCTGERQAESSTLPCAMGVDVGKKKHVTIGYKINKKQYEIIRVAIVDSFDDVHDLARRYNVKTACIDIRPYEDEVRRFQKAEPYLVFLCEYGDNALQDIALNDKTRTFKVYRTGIFDQTGRLVRDVNITFPRRDAAIDEFAEQLCNTAKRLESNKRSGADIYRYVKLGQEHFRNSLNYFILACAKAPMVHNKLYDRKHTDQSEYCSMEYSVI